MKNSISEQPKSAAKSSQALSAFIRKKRATLRTRSGKPTSDTPNSSRFSRREAEQLTQAKGVIVALNCIRTDLEGADTGYQIMLRRSLAKIYRVALVVHNNNDAWADLCTDEAWTKVQDRNRPRIADRSDALRHTIRFALGFDGPAVTKRVSEINTALEPFFCRKAKVQEVERRLSESGLSQLIKDGRSSRRGSGSARARQPNVAIGYSDPALKKAILNSEDGRKITLLTRVCRDDKKSFIRIEIDKTK